jgi:hypothetical protein
MKWDARLAHFHFAVPSVFIDNEVDADSVGQAKK